MLIIYTLRRTNNLFFHLGYGGYGGGYSGYGHSSGYSKNGYSDFYDEYTRRSGKVDGKYMHAVHLLFKKKTVQILL